MADMSPRTDTSTDDTDDNHMASLSFFLFSRLILVNLDMIGHKASIVQFHVWRKLLNYYTNYHSKVRKSINSSNRKLKQQGCLTK
jgi:hypothetical protein